MLPILLFLVALAALVPIVLPLLRGGRAVADRGSFDRAVYRDQLQELDRDVARGVIALDEAESARLEIQRRLLATATDSAPAARPGRSPWLALVLGVFVVIGAGAVYVRIGAPGVPDLPYAARPPGDALAGDDRQDMRQIAARLAEKLAADPNDARSWLLFGRAQAILGTWDRAADAFKRAMTLGQTGPEVQAGYGEMLVMQARGIVTPDARTAFDAALKADPQNEVARYYLALATAQGGQPAQAIDRLQALAADLSADSPMRDQLARRVAEFARQAGVAAPALVEGKPQAGPDAAAMAQAAQMPEADRKAMIEGMVQKLATRLADSPNDRDGWIRLGRAYAVLEQRDKAADAFVHAADVAPAQPELKLMAVQALLDGLKPGDAFPDRAASLLRDVAQVAPDRPAVLWYQGVVAVRDGHRDEARAAWTRLLSKLPPDSEDARLVKAALEQVK
ncbi:MAG: c-type cytochrome biogenesis protein CcmI [Rhodospirillales bacterium]|nr:c-type cytochrome biogenesis protein CcmI [Rhodospirillales bacterium]